MGITDYLLPAIGGIAGSLFGGKEDPEVKANRLAARNIAMFGGRPTPAETTSMVQGAQSSFNKQRQQSIDAYKEQLRKQGQLSPGLVSRGVTDISRDVAGQLGEAINQYKTQVAMDSGNRSLQTAQMLANLPGYTPDPKSQGIVQGISSAISGIDTIKQNKRLDELTDTYLKSLESPMAKPNTLAPFREGVELPVTPMELFKRKNPLLYPEYGGAF